MTNNFAITVIKANGSDNITATPSKKVQGMFTIMGTIHDAEQHHKVRGGMANLSDSYFGVTAAVMVNEDQLKEILDATADYYAGNLELGSKDPKVGLCFEAKLGDIASGVHPTTGEKTMNVIVRNAVFTGVTEGHNFNLDVDALMSSSEEAARIAAERSQASLKQSTANRLAQQAITAVTPAKSTARRKAPVL